MRLSVVATAICLSIVGLSTASDVDASIRKAINIPAQGLGPALQTLAKDRDFQVIYRSEVVGDLRTGGASGELTSDEALKQLLSGTGLAYRYLDENTVTIVPLQPLGMIGSEALAPLIGSEREGRPGAGKVRLAQANNPSTETGEGSDPRNGTGEDYEVQELPAPEETRKAIPEILVIGSKSLNMAIERTRDDAQPYQIYSKDTIQKSGASTVGDFLREKLAADPLPVLNSQQNTNNGNASTINLRGLGTAQTLILIDGHRAAGYALTGNAAQPDLNGIPLSAIERIEVLPGTASGIYGGSATGGVVNVVLRHDYQGLSTTVGYEDPFDAGGATRRFELSSGLSLEGGRTNVLIVGSFSESGSLVAGDREFLPNGRAALIAANPGAVFNSPTPPLGPTTNIRSSNGSPLVLKSGTSLNSPITFIPSGYDGMASDGGAALLSNAGQYNLGFAATAQDSGGAYRTLLNGTEIKSARVTLRREFHDKVSAFVELSGSRNSSERWSKEVAPLIETAG